NFSYFYFACFQSAIGKSGWLLQSLTSRARYFQSFYRAPFFRLMEITFRLPACLTRPDVTMDKRRESSSFRGACRYFQ
ncbi:TPA: hypothetical protein ACGR99_006745, partial [Pseudomonas aeruginosa]